MLRTVVSFYWESNRNFWPKHCSPSLAFTLCRLWLDWCFVSISPLKKTKVKLRCSQKPVKLVNLIEVYLCNCNLWWVHTRNQLLTSTTQTPASTVISCSNLQRQFRITLNLSENYLVFHIPKKRKNLRQRLFALRSGTYQSPQSYYALSLLAWAVKLSAPFWSRKSPMAEFCWTRWGALSFLFWCDVSVGIHLTASFLHGTFRALFPAVCREQILIKIFPC